MEWLIRGENDPLDGLPLYWSNTDGWVSRATATVFSDDERNSLNLPDVGTWVSSDAPEERLEYLRGEIRAERISYGEIAELTDLANYIEPSDVELLEWAGVEEFGPEREAQAKAYAELHK